MKSVKLVSLSIENLGVLKAISLKIDTTSDRLVLKGGSGSGKTTLQEGIRVLTSGGGEQNFSKNMGGKYVLRGWLEDGNYVVKVIFQEKKYILEATDKRTGEVVCDIDGVPLNAKKYLSILNDQLKKGINKFCSSNSTEQRTFALSLFKNEIAKSGASELQKELSILLEKRTMLDLARKQVGEGVVGTRDWLVANGINPEIEGAVKKIDPTPITEAISDLQAERRQIISSPQQEKNRRLKEVEGEMYQIVADIKIENAEIDKRNAKIQEKESDLAQSQLLVKEHFSTTAACLQKMATVGAISGDAVEDFLRKIQLQINSFLSKKIEIEKENKVLFSEKNGRQIVSTEQVGLREKAKSLFSELQELRKVYAKLVNSQDDEPDTSIVDEKITEKIAELEEVEKNNLKHKALEAFLSWQSNESDINSKNLEIQKLLTEINCGVEGMAFIFDEKENKVNLCYNGIASPDFFNVENANQFRPIADFSQSQRALICLFLQIARMKKNEGKSVNICYFDEAMCKKTYELATSFAKNMGVEVCVVCSQIGDFDAKSLKQGEILLENGEVLLPHNEKNSPHE